MNKFESKYFNTSIVMDEALISLLETKEYDFISIKELCDKAGVNRSTFYLHYEKMDDLLEETIKYIQKSFVQQFDTTQLSKQSLSELSLSDKMFIKKEYLEPFLTFFKENRKVLRLYKKMPYIFNTEKTYLSLQKQLLLDILKDFGVSEEIRKYYISFYIHGFFSIIYSWIDNDCAESIEEMMQIIINVLRLQNYSGETYEKNN